MFCQAIEDKLLKLRHDFLFIYTKSTLQMLDKIMSRIDRERIHLP